MRVTPLDIRHKEFSRSVRGYKDAEVDEFLDQITEEFERVFNENIDLNEKLETLGDKISQYKNIEDTLQKTLVSAQQQAEELKQNAQKEADLILRDAELKTRTIVNDSYAERQKIQRSIQGLKQKHEEMRYQLRKLIETYANLLEQDLDTVGDLPEPESVPATESPESLGGVEEAVSSELLNTEAIQSMPPERPLPQSDPWLDQPSASEEMSVPGLGEEKSVVGIPPLKPAATADDDPFADVEIDTEESRFHW
jgi:cell division initiation protein